MLDNMTFFTGRRATAVGSLVLAMGTLVLLQTLLSPRYEAPMTDLGRDLVAGQAVNNGVNPYQQMAALQEEMPELQVSESAEDFWVAHSPLSIALARLIFNVAGDSAIDVGRIGGTAGVIALLAWVLMGSGTRRVSPARMVSAGALAMSIGIESDIVWVQGAGLLGLLLGAVVYLCHSERRALALAVMGFAVAWKPWCAPIALFLPGRRMSRDVAGIATVALLLTVVAAPFIGGWDSMRSWVTEAIPANTDAYLRYEWNVSLTGPYLGVFVGLLFFACVVLACFLIRQRLTDVDRLRLGSIVILGFFPIVWVHYWTALSLLTLGQRESERLAVGIAFLFMATPLVGTNPIATKIGAGAAFLTVVALLLFDRSGDGTVSAESKGSYVGLGLLTQESTNVDQPKSQR